MRNAHGARYDMSGSYKVIKCALVELSRPVDRSRPAACYPADGLFAIDKPAFAYWVPASTQPKKQNYLRNRRSQGALKKKSDGP
jgi:hypothetical protein